jgi:hypothetical protein
MAPSRAGAKRGARLRAPAETMPTHAAIATLLKEASASHTEREWQQQVTALSSLLAAVGAAGADFPWDEAVPAAGLSIPGGRSDVQKAAMAFLKVRDCCVKQPADITPH